MNWLEFIYKNGVGMADFLFHFAFRRWTTYVGYWADPKVDSQRNLIARTIQDVTG